MLAWIARDVMDAATRRESRESVPLASLARALHTRLPLRASTAALVLTAAALASTAIVFAQARPPSRFMDVSEIRPGMRGYGLTVFRGTQPERFDVEVLDILHNHRPQMDMILIRPTHPILEHAGTVAGMSGSPIFLNDRMIGAYAYGWEFGRDPVAGVTPIANMLSELHRSRRTPPGILPGSQVPIPISAMLPPGTALRRSGWDALADRARLARTSVPTAFGQLVSLAVPLNVSGMSPGALRYLSNALEPFGLEPIQAGGSSNRNAPLPPGSPTTYVNGGSISVSIVSGDIAADSSGTATLVDGNDVLAYGHPFMGLGEVAMTASLSRVAWILASTRRSTKIVEVTRELGALVQDRQFAIVVNTRATAPRVPVQIRITGNGQAQHNVWNLQIAYHRSVLPRLLSAAIGSVLEVAAGDTADAAWVVHSHVRTQNHGTLEFTDHGASAGGPTGMSISALGQTEAIERLGDNPFEQVRIERVDVDVDIRWARDFYFVRSVSLAREEVDPGETVNVLVSLAQYGSAPIVRTIPITIPREAAGRDLELEVGGGNDIALDLPEPENIGDLIRNLTTFLPEDSLVVSMRMPGNGVALRGRLVSNLPGSALDALRPAASTDGGDPVGNFRRTSVTTSRIVLGRDRVRLRVREVRQ